MNTGEQYMFLVFIDESGKPDRKRDPYVVCALMIHDSDFIAIEEGIDEIIGRTLKVDNPGSVEIHGKDIFQNKGIFKMFSMEKRRELVDNIIEFIESDLSGRAKAVIVVFDKNRILSKPYDYARKRMVSIAYKFLMERIAWLVREWGPELTLLINDQSELDYDIIDAVKYEIINGIYTSRIVNTRYFIKTPLFVESQEYRMLQIADLIAYIYARIYKGKPKIAKGFFDLTNYFQKILPMIRSGPNGRIKGYGIKIWKE